MEYKKVNSKSLVRIYEISKILYNLNLLNTQNNNELKGIFNDYLKKEYEEYQKLDVNYYDYLNYAKRSKQYSIEKDLNGLYNEERIKELAIEERIKKMLLVNSLYSVKFEKTYAKLINSIGNPEKIMENKINKLLKLINDMNEILELNSGKSVSSDISDKIIAIYDRSDEIEAKIDSIDGSLKQQYELYKKIYTYQKEICHLLEINYDSIEEKEHKIAVVELYENDDSSKKILEKDKKFIMKIYAMNMEHNYPSYLTKLTFKNLIEFLKTIIIIKKSNSKRINEVKTTLQYIEPYYGNQLSLIDFSKELIDIHESLIENLSEIQKNNIRKIMSKEISQIKKCILDLVMYTDDDILDKQKFEQFKVQLSYLSYQMWLINDDEQISNIYRHFYSIKQEKNHFKVNMYIEELFDDVMTKTINIKVRKRQKLKKQENIKQEFLLKK